jgi:hypothetical protein
MNKNFLIKKKTKKILKKLIIGKIEADLTLKLNKILKNKIKIAKLLFKVKKMFKKKKKISILKRILI